MTRWYKDRPPPFSNTIICGDSPIRKISDGVWVDSNTGEPVEAIETTMENIYVGVEKMTIPKSIQEIRETKAKIYACELDSEYRDNAIEDFCAGYDAGFAQQVELTRELISAVEEYSEHVVMRQANGIMDRPLREALEKYKKATGE